MCQTDSRGRQGNLEWFLNANKSSRKTIFSALHRRPDYFHNSARFMAEEIFDVVNDRDEVIGQAPRKEVHARGLWHRAVHVLVFNTRGEVFLQKRSMLKDTAKGKWDSSSSGHVDTGEDYDICAVRELREEIGLVINQAPQRLYKINACPETGWEFCWVYRCASEGPFTLHPEEIETGDWFAPQTVTKWVAEKPEDFASGFILVWQRFLAMGGRTERG